MRDGATETATASTGYTMPLCVAESWGRLKGKRFGRLAISLDGQPEIFTVSFFASDWRLYLRMEPGTLLATAPMGTRVAFEVDDSYGNGAWTVVAKGTVCPTLTGDLEAARRAPKLTWAAEDDGAQLAIQITDLTGRLFQRT